MQKAFPEKTPFLCPNLLFVFKSGREKSFPTSDFVKWIAKNTIHGENHVKLQCVQLQPSPFRGENVGKKIKRRISVVLN